MKSVAIDHSDQLKEAFVQTAKPLGLWFAGELSEMGSREQFDLFQESAEKGCSWGQVQYADYFRFGSEFVAENEQELVEWLEKAAAQQNPLALYFLGGLYDGGRGWTFRYAAAALGWKDALEDVASLWREGHGCEEEDAERAEYEPKQDLYRALQWSAPGASHYRGVFWETLIAKEKKLPKWNCDFSRLCYLWGWGLYWYYDPSPQQWNNCTTVHKVFGNQCLDYYCSCVQVQQKSIWTFLLWWKQQGLLKEVGVLIAQRVWEERAENLIEKADFTKGF
jgi:hypothetical protein